MKYLVIVMVVIMLVRIDMIILGVETLGKKIKEKTQSTPAPPQSMPQPEILIPVSEDKAIARTPRSEFFTLLSDFQIRPEAVVRERLADVLRRNPAVLGTKLDPVFEGEVFKMADLIYNKEPELPLLLVDFLSLLQGENLEMVRRFFTILLDNDVEAFLKAYVKTKDTNCMIASLMGHRVPEEELLNEFTAREERLRAFLAKDKIDPQLAGLAKNCQLVVQVELNKLNPPAPETAPAPEGTPEP